MKKYFHTYYYIIFVLIIAGYCLSLSRFKPISVLGESRSVEAESSGELRRSEVRRLRVGYADDSSFIMKKQDGTYYGYGVDYLQKISESTGWEYEYIECSFSAACRMLETGELDLICTMQKTPEREELYGFSEYPCGWEYTSLYVGEDSDIRYEEFNRFSTLRIGFLENFESNREFERYAAEHAFTYVPFYYETAEEMDQAFLTGEINAITRNNLRKEVGKRLVAKYAIDPFYFAVSKKEESLLKELDKALKQIKLENPYYEYTLQEKYYGKAEIHGVFLTREEQQFIESSDPFTVVYVDGLEPVSYEQDGSPQGISEEIFQAISESSGLMFHYHRAENIRQAYAMVEHGEADILACIENREAFESNIDHTISYFSIPVAIISKDNASVLKEKPVIALRAGDPGLENYLQEVFPEYLLLSVRTTRECFRAVLAGDADFCVDNLYLSENLLELKEFHELFISQVMGYETEICAGVNKSLDPMLLKLLNRSIISVPSADKIQMAARALTSKEANPSLFQYLWLHKEEAFIFLLICLSFGLAAASYLKYKKQQELEQLAYFDALTGFRNGEKFKLDLKKRLAEEKNRNYVIIYFELNRFRDLNSILGMQLSNEVICSLAERMEAFLREDEFAGRNYADNFLAFCRCDSRDELMERLKNLNMEFQADMAAKNIYYKVPLFAGIYHPSEETGDPAEMIYRAALAKQACRQGNLFAFFDSRMEAQMKKEVEIESIMEDALKNGEFLVYFQPKYAIENESIVGAEALVRWKRPDGSMIYPDSFIPLFEKNGFIVSLDYYVYEKVLQWLRERKKQGLPLVRISVNLSRLHSEDGRLADHLTSMAEQYGIEPEWVEFELTESALTEDSSNLLGQIKKLRQNRFTISIDDFGAGYSSLNLLRNVSADIIKIDKGFLDESGDSVRSSRIIRGILVMAKDINMEVICEGVETKEQLDFLREAHCDYVQGYYFARPMCRGDFEEKLLKEGVIPFQSAIPTCG